MYTIHLLHTLVVRPLTEEFEDRVSVGTGEEVSVEHVIGDPLCVSWKPPGRMFEILQVFSF